MIRGTAHPITCAKLAADKVLRTRKITGYAGAGNQGIELSKGICIYHKPDIILEPEYFEKAAAKMSKEKDVAAQPGKFCSTIFGG